MGARLEGWATRAVPATAPPVDRVLRVVDQTADHDDFARSVERDLAALPTVDDHD